MNNRDVFVSHCVILAKTFFSTRGLDLCGLTIKPSIKLLCRQKFLEDRNLERPPAEFNVYDGKLLRVSAQHIGFVFYFKITQTCILRYYSTYCKQIGRKSNCLLVKRQC